MGMIKLLKKSEETDVGETEAQPKDDSEEVVQIISKAVSSWYVRKDSKYFAVDRLNVKLSMEDVQRSCVFRIKEEFGHLKPTREIMKEVFHLTIVKKHSDTDTSIPVWNGGIVCKPGNPKRFIWDLGTVAINAWNKPAYRNLEGVDPSFGLAGDFFDWFFTREEEKQKFLDWLSWNLQNEDQKPSWAPFFYSATKGSGKSTLCKLVARLFGDQNTVCENSVDKLTGKFNSPILSKKLVISEEVDLRANSKQGNALKTYITESDAVVERKGVDAERVEQFCCFMFTSNHLPLWIEEEERRYYLIEVDHDGHATGPKGGEFAALVGELNEFMADDRCIAGLYGALMERRQAAKFNAKWLNVQEEATPLMKQVHAASEGTRKAMLREMLDSKELKAISEAKLTEFVKKELHANLAQTKHLITELGWSKDNVKWDGCDYARAVWTAKGYWVDRGKLKGPDGFEEQDLGEHLKVLEVSGDLLGH
ncbi:hypothetical protein GCM10011363_00040 [Marivita lacus]|uniref:NrS-1 polymerase-like helicase domain-containing protein n=1 Tax=Marivita lacus TaxID=1323742 RepID=A0ABQ1K4G6_9RHOB|nr:primase-helicase family protein [Marivita lacus]GGB87401.1 hypothetical protein GCM10011363_00040 [Marivita lacus]